MIFRVCLLVVTGVSLSAGGAVAQQGAAPPCSTPQHRMFDFWLGEWEVTQGGQLAGTNTITRTLNGCVVHENYRTATGGYAGQSFNIYDASRDRWHQTWVDNGGLLLELDGAFVDGKMILEGTTLDSAGAEQLNRISWSVVDDGNVRQLWQQSADAGQTWSVLFDGLYTKRESN